MIAMSFYYVSGLDICKILSETVIEVNDDECRLMCAEIWRNIGEFEKCKSLLKEIVDPDEFEPYISMLYNECKKRNMLTVQVG